MMVQVESLCIEVKGDLSRMVKNKLEAQSQCQFFKKTINHEFFLSSGNTTEFNGWTAKSTDIGGSVR